MSDKLQKKVASILAKAGISLNGNQPYDLKINNPKLFKRVFSSPSLGLGESYMDGWWDCERLDEFFYRLLRQVNPQEIYPLHVMLKFLIENFFTNQQSILRSKKVAKIHYNLGNDLYQAMLGETMAYTCAYWLDAESLDQAQKQKYDLICRKMELKKGESILELGCGFGGFSKFAAENYGVSAVAVNISTTQMAYAAKICQGLPIRLATADYRDVASYNPAGEKFDKVISIGMCEHVGYKNYDKFLQIARSQLKPEGLFLLHTIGKNNSQTFTDPWISKYIFPNGMLPSIKLLSQAAEDKFVVEDIHNFGADYDKTLIAWYENFNRAWPNLKSAYDQRFYRMWRYYLLSCAGSFRARDIQLWQFVLSPTGKLNGYRSVR